MPQVANDFLPPADCTATFDQNGVLHDDAQREYAYGPAQGLPASKVGTFTQSLYDEAEKNDWGIISMNNDWGETFEFW